MTVEINLKTFAIQTGFLVSSLVNYSLVNLLTPEAHM